MIENIATKDNKRGFMQVYMHGFLGTVKYPPTRVVFEKHNLKEQKEERHYDMTPKTNLLCLLICESIISILKYEQEMHSIFS
jgi:hypothetical protein